MPLGILDNIPDIIDIKAKMGNRYTVVVDSWAVYHYPSFIINYVDINQQGWQFVLKEASPTYLIPDELKGILVQTGANYYEFNQLLFPQHKDYRIFGKFRSEYTGFSITNLTTRGTPLIEAISLLSFDMNEIGYAFYELGVSGNDLTFILDRISERNKGRYEKRGKASIEELRYDPKTMNLKLKFSMYPPELEPYLSANDWLYTKQLNNRGMKVEFYGFAYNPKYDYEKVIFSSKYYRVKRGIPQMLKIKYSEPIGIDVYVSPVDIEIDMTR